MRRISLCRLVRVAGLWPRSACCRRCSAHFLLLRVRASCCAIRSSTSCSSPGRSLPANGLTIRVERAVELVLRALADRAADARLALPRLGVLPVREVPVDPELRGVARIDEAGHADLAASARTAARRAPCTSGSRGRAARIAATSAPSAPPRARTAAGPPAPRARARSCPSSCRSPDSPARRWSGRRRCAGPGTRAPAASPSARGAASSVPSRNPSVANRTALPASVFQRGRTCVQKASIRSKPHPPTGRSPDQQG